MKWILDLFAVCCNFLCGAFCLICPSAALLKTIQGDKEGNWLWASGEARLWNLHSADEMLHWMFLSPSASLYLFLPHLERSHLSWAVPRESLRLAFLICTNAPIPPPPQNNPCTLQPFSGRFDVWFIRNRFPHTLVVCWWISLWWAGFVMLPQIRRLWKMCSVRCDLSEINRQSFKEDSHWSTFWGTKDLSNLYGGSKLAKSKINK